MKRSRERPPTPRSPWFYWSLGLVVVLLMMVWQRVQVRRFSARTLELQQAVDRYRFENGRLQTQIHQWTSPTHLESLARQELGFQSPLPQQQRRLGVER